MSAIRFCWLTLLCCVLAATAQLAAAASMSEKAAFNAARVDFELTVWERAEVHFGEFITNFPNSAQVPEARLFQAQARYQQGNYAGAVELLSAHVSGAGKLADQYQFWLAQAQFQNGNHAAAAESFAKLVSEFPGSARRLEGAIGEALARVKLEQWAKVIELLQNPAGFFQQTAKTNATNELIPRGQLLLAEALAGQKDYRAAEAVLQPLGTNYIPKLAWQWQYLMCRIQLADGRAEQALGSTSNLLSQAADANQPALLAESVAFKAQVLETLGRTDAAIDTYKDNLKPSAPAERQRQALLKVRELYLAQNKPTEAAAVLEKFVTDAPTAATADLALLTLGELRLRYYAALSETNQTAPTPANAAAMTNQLLLARGSLETLTTNFPQSAWVGKGYLDLGWCLWLQGKMAEAQGAFRTASERLPASIDRAIAYFKLADAQFQQQDLGGAITNYRAVIEKFNEVAEVKSNLLELALYQTVRVGLAANDLAVATNAMHAILAAFPNSFRAERALLLTGQAIGRQGRSEEARNLLLDFVKKAPQAGLLPEVHLAIARTYETEGKWVEAIAQYDQWVQTYPTNAARARAEYCRGWANSQAGRETNALTQFTNLVAQFPACEFAPHAQWWVANYYFHTGNYKDAEINYQSLFQSTNKPPGELAYQAQMMAGRVAVARQGWSDAIRYFLNLSTNANCPPDLVVQALFAYGDTLMSVPDPGETNRVTNYKEAILVFQNICQTYPTNKHAVLAWGQRANCYLQWAQNSRVLELDTNVFHGFQQVLQSPAADITARSIATVGLALLLEKQAEQKSGADRTALLERAFGHYLDVFDGTLARADEKPDMFWVRKSGLEAGRLAEALQKWLPAKRIYERLRELLPVNKTRFDKNIARVQEQLR